jgi:hypothetical protein
MQPPSSTGAGAKERWVVDYVGARVLHYAALSFRVNPPLQSFDSDASTLPCG